MAALSCTTDQGESPSHKNLLLRMMDSIAAQQMSYAHRAISRGRAYRSKEPSLSGSTKDDAPPFAD